MAELKGYFYFVIFNVANQSTSSIVLHQYYNDPLSNYCFSCSIGETGHEDKIILIGGWSNAGPRLWAYNSDGTRLFSVEIACSRN